MANPVSMTMSEDGMLYVLNDDGSVYSKRPEIGSWNEIEPVPGTSRRRERAGNEKDASVGG